MTKPICTKCTPASLPGLLERLENETVVRWTSDDEGDLPTTPNLNRWFHGPIDHICFDNFKSDDEPDCRIYVTVAGGRGLVPDLSAVSPDTQLVTPNEFVRLVSAACGKD